MHFSRFLLNITQRLQARAGSERHLLGPGLAILLGPEPPPPTPGTPRIPSSIGSPLAAPLATRRHIPRGQQVGNRARHLYRAGVCHAVAKCRTQSLRPRPQGEPNHSYVSRKMSRCGVCPPELIRHDGSHFP